MVACVAAFSGCSEDETNTPPAGAPTTSLSAGMSSVSDSGTTDSSGTGTGTGTDTGTTDGTTTDSGSTTADTSSSSTGGGTSGSASGSTGGTDGGSTGAVTDLLSGQFVDGSGGTYVPPFTCSIRFHAPGEIEPTTGVDSGFTLQQTFTIDSFPSDWVVTAQSSGGAINVGDTGYVTASCDTDGDFLNDDNVGGWYPTLPLDLVTVPAAGLDISIADL